MAAEGAREAAGGPAALGRELADCLWAVLVLTRLHEVDLAAEFRRMTDDLERTPAARLNHQTRRSNSVRFAACSDELELLERSRTQRAPASDCEAR